MMRTKLIAIALVLGVVPAQACGGLIRDLIDPNCKPPPPMVWVKAGTAEFAQTRYRCLREAQQPSSAAVFGNGSGGMSSGMGTNDQLFGACMNASGWILRPR